VLTTGNLAERRGIGDHFFGWGQRRNMDHRGFEKKVEERKTKRRKKRWRRHPIGARKGKKPGGVLRVGFEKKECRVKLLGREARGNSAKVNRDLTKEGVEGWGATEFEGGVRAK